MLRSYLKISITVLLRRRFLTLVNVFSSVLTLTALVVAFAILESMISPAGAESGRDHILVVDNLRLRDAGSR